MPLQLIKNILLLIMSKNLFNKKRNGIATITIVLLLGFLSLLSSTSIFTYNAWRWENLENNIKREAQQQGINSASLYAYILLARQRDDTAGSWPVYDTSENLLEVWPSTLTISTVDTLDECNLASSAPAEISTKTIKKISVLSQKNNVLISKSCCTAGTYKDSTDEEVETEALIYQYSKQGCKNFNWPNLKDLPMPLMSGALSQ